MSVPQIAPTPVRETAAPISQRRPRILIAGGGYVGMYTALTLQKRLRDGEAEVIVVDPRSYMTYQPFLPEAAAGNIEPRHVVVPLRRVLPKCDVITGRVTGIKHAERTAVIATDADNPYELTYDLLVIALGSIVRTLPIPGLAEFGIGFKQVEEAIALRNQVLEKLDRASSTTNQEIRRKALTFVFVGGGYAGVEALAELEDMARDATVYYPSIAPADLRWVLVEATGRILPEVGEDMGLYTVEELGKRGIEVLLDTRLDSCVDGHIELSDGQRFDAETLVWTAGVKANPLLGRTDLPLDDKGRITCRVDLTVNGAPGAWAAGDCAACPIWQIPASSPGPALSTPSGRPAASATTLCARCAGSRWWTTSIGTPARSPPSDCTRASRTSTASSARDGPPGSSTAPTT